MSSLIRGSRMDATPRQFIDIQQLSLRSGRSVKSLRRDVQNGRLEAFQPGGRGGKLLFHPDAIEKAKVAAITAPPAEPHRPLAGRRPKWMTDSGSSGAAP